MSRVSAAERNVPRRLERAAPAGVRSPADTLLRLQRTAGNAAVGRLLQRCPDGSDPTCPCSRRRDPLLDFAAAHGRPVLARTAADPLADLFAPAGFTAAEPAVAEPAELLGPVPEPAAAVRPAGVDGFDEGPGCRYEPGEKEASEADLGDATLSSGLVPNALEEANETRRFFLAQGLGVDVERLDAELEKRGLPPAPPPFTPAPRGELVLSGFSQGSAELKGRHFDFLRARVPELGLDSATPRYRVDRIEGFTDCVDSFARNAGIRRARAQEARIGLLVTGALPENVGPAVASQAAARVPDQTTRAGRAANRAAVVHLELVGTPRPEPRPELPNQTQPTCELPSDDWALTTVAMGGAQVGLGAVAIGMVFINNRTGCFHPAAFVSAGLAGPPGAGLSMSHPSSSSLPALPAEAFSFELSGFGLLGFAEIGAGPAGAMVGRLVMQSGALAGETLDVGGFQTMTPGVDLGLMFGFLFVQMDGTRL